VVVGLLFLPDLTSLEIPGILRVERKLDEQARRQDEIASMIQRLELSIAQRVEVNINDVGSMTARVVRLADQQEEKREQLDSPAS
jgi:hypothetical protein